MRTPGRSALRERNGIRNETFVSGSNMTKASIATIDGHIFSNADVASSTLRGDQTPVSTILIHDFEYVIIIREIKKI